MKILMPWTAKDGRNTGSFEMRSRALQRHVLTVCGRSKTSEFLVGMQKGRTAPRHAHNLNERIGAVGLSGGEFEGDDVAQHKQGFAFMGSQ
jgi:hypothetical protein